MVLNVAKDFSPYPSGRYKRDGPHSGEVFRDDWLVPALQESQELVVELDDVEGYGSSFLEEAFGGLVRKGFSTADVLKNQLKLTSSDDALIEEIRSYIDEAESGDR